MRNLTTLFLLIFTIISFDLDAQDPHFSQFYISPLTLNPALTGMKNGDVRVAANYRRQWVTISEPYQTMSIAADYNLFRGDIGDNMMGVGLIIFNDKAGTSSLQRTRIAATLGYSQNVGVEGSYLSVGFEAGMMNQRMDPTQLLFENQYDGVSLNDNIGSDEDFINTSIWNVDVTAGIAWSYTPDKYTSFYAGGSIGHLNQPEINFLINSPDNLSMKYTVYGGAEFRINGYLSALPRAVILKQGTHTEINAGFYAKLHLGEPRSEHDFAVSIGAMYRLKDAIIPMLRVDYGPIAVGLSYDLNISKLAAASNTQGGAELSFIFKGISNKNDISPIPCPSF
jgi:type IX secretion system PorP/SprF family membrane protein